MNVRVPNVENHGIFAEHDQACAICHVNHAVFDCGSGIFFPCWRCQENGWTLRRKRVWPWQR